MKPIETIDARKPVTTWPDSPPAPPFAACSGLVVAGVALCVICCCPAGKARADDDVVYVRPKGRPQAEIRLEGEIIHWDKSGIKLRLRPSGNVREVAADELVRWQLRLLPDQERAEKLYREGKYREAVSSYQSARQQEKRPWLRERIGAQIVWCQRSLGEPFEAAETFISLGVRGSNDLGFSALPLKWAPTPVEQPVRLKARAWAETHRDSPAAALLAASYTLFGDDAADAKRRLEELVTHPDEGISGLARAQLWRLEVGQTKGEDLRRWSRVIQQMPTDLRGGPYYLLGAAFEAAGEPVEAALTFLWLPLVYQDDQQLAAEAGFRAAELLNQAGRIGEAQILYRDVSERFGRTSYGADARSRLRSEQSSKPAGAPTRSD